MGIKTIVAEIDAEISRLQQVKTLLTGNSAAGKGHAKRTSGAGLSAIPAPRRTMSAEVRSKIAAAQKARWAKVRKSAK